MRLLNWRLSLLRSRQDSSGTGLHGQLEHRAQYIIGGRHAAAESGGKGGGTLGRSARAQGLRVNELVICTHARTQTYRKDKGKSPGSREIRLLPGANLGGTTITTTAPHFRDTTKPEGGVGEHTHVCRDEKVGKSKGQSNRTRWFRVFDWTRFGGG